MAVPIEKLGRFWELIPVSVAHNLVGKALWPLRGRRKGMFTNDEIRDLIADVLELPAPARIDELNNRQCQTLIWRLIVRGMI
jgi:hypothetical protein